MSEKNNQKSADIAAKADEPLDISELKSQLEEKERKISVLEWDKERNQLQYSKESYLKKLKEEADELRSRIRSAEDNLK